MLFQEFYRTTVSKTTLYQTSLSTNQSACNRSTPLSLQLRCMERNLTCYMFSCFVTNTAQDVGVLDAFLFSAHTVGLTYLFFEHTATNMPEGSPVAWHTYLQVCVSLLDDCGC